MPLENAPQVINRFEHQHSSSHLMYPDEGGKSLSAMKWWQKALNEKVVIRDEKAALYIYEQSTPDSSGQGRSLQRGVIGMISMEDDKQLLLHEEVILEQLEQRVRLLDTTGIQSSPTHGFYTLETTLLEELMEEALHVHCIVSHEFQGTTYRIGKITDPKKIALFQEVLGAVPAYLADGHHRYRSSQVLYHRDKSASYHLIYLTNITHNDMSILPTHRLLKNVRDFSLDRMISALQPYFHCEVCASPEEVVKQLKGRYGFGLIHRNYALSLTLKAGLSKHIPWVMDESVKDIATTVLHYYLIEKVFGISGQAQVQSRLIAYQNDLIDCLDELNAFKTDYILLNNGVTAEELMNATKKGERMLPKSTCFVPKMVSGHIFGDIRSL
ncbi:DUF1015 domain-containing protein [Algivirga pacifica]|uniref:DUF1015 domain-containing protein n=2 Tax=Algivirga pacifica TaxID=1162670 RepID=A0ABP9DPU7_9BACT